MNRDGETYSLIDLNRAGVPLLEIVSEPDLHSAEEVRDYAQSLRSLLRYLGVYSGDRRKRVMRIEPNVSVRPAGSQELGTRVEIKNLNSFRALERGVAYEIQRQSDVLRQGKKVVQETVGWVESKGMTVTQRVKETEDDYRYFPEPDLPPLVIEPQWVERIRASLPELPIAKCRRFRRQYGLNDYDAGVLTAERPIADYFEQAVAALPKDDAGAASPKSLANWISGELFGLLNQTGMSIEEIRITPQSLAGLVQMVARGEINQNTDILSSSEIPGDRCIPPSHDPCARYGGVRDHRLRIQDIPAARPVVWTNICLSLLFLSLKYVLLVAFAFLFSTVSTSFFLPIFGTLAVYFVGSSLQQVYDFLHSSAAQSYSPFIKRIATGLYYLLPNFSAFDLSVNAIYGIGLSLQGLVLTACYFAVYTAVILTLSAIIFSRREMQ